MPPAKPLSVYVSPSAVSSTVAMAAQVPSGFRRSTSNCESLPVPGVQVRVTSLSSVAVAVSPVTAGSATASVVPAASAWVPAWSVGVAETT